jgi:hypothetical protein
MIGQVSLSTDYQPHSAQTWFVIATVNSGAKYAEKISPNITAESAYTTKREIEMFIKKLSSCKAMNCPLFHWQIN